MPSTKSLIKKITREKHITVILSTPHVKIFTVSGKDPWNVKYPYRLILKKKGRWTPNHYVMESLDIALLLYLEQKYLGDQDKITNILGKILNKTHL